MRQHHPFLPFKDNPDKCASGRDGDTSVTCNQPFQDHLGRIQRHKFYSGDPDHPERCTMKSDYIDGICFDHKINHFPITTESNPYLKTEAERISRTMQKDLDIAKEIRASLESLGSAQQTLGRQVWEARIKVLSVALTAIQGLSDDE